MPKSLFVDPAVVRAPGEVTFNTIPVNQYNKTIKDELKSGKFTKEDLIRIFRDMTVLREFETMLGARLQKDPQTNSWALYFSS